MHLLHPKLRPVMHKKKTKLYQGEFVKFYGLRNKISYNNIACLMLAWVQSHVSFCISDDVDTLIEEFDINISERNAMKQQFTLLVYAVLSKKILVPCTSIEENLADNFTKPMRDFRFVK